MALDNNTQLVYTDKTTLKNWFKRLDKPKQAQFWEWFDSYWHKSESLPISSISGLGDLIDGKAETEHTHSEYAKNDATSLTAQNITQWQNKLGINDLDYVVIPTEDATENSHPYVVVIDNEGKSARRNATDFGKVDTIDGIEPEENKDVKLGAVRKSESNEVEAGFDLHQVDGASIGVDVNGVKVFKGGITATFGTTSIYVDNLVPDAAYKFQEILFPKRLVKNVEEKVYPVTYVNGVKANENGRVDISGIPWNFANSSIRYSGILDKSADATYNQLLGVDSNGYVAKVGLNAVTNAMVKSTDAQKDAFRIASRKSGETYSTGQPRVDTILPPVIDNTKDYIQYVTLVGLNLFVNNSNPSTASVSIIRYKDINNQLIPEETHIIDNYQVYQTNQSILSFGIDYSLFPTGYYKVKVVHNGFENIGTSDILVTTQVTTKPIVLDNWEVYTPYDASSLIVSPTSIKKTYTTNRGNILEQQVKHFIILEEDVINGFRINFTYKLTPAGSELGNVTWRSAINFGLGYDKPVNGTIVPEILVSFFRGVITVGTKTLNIPIINAPTVYDIDIVVKNGLATVIVNSKADGKILTNTFSFEQLNKKMYFYSTFIGSNADSAIQINGTVQELLFTNTYQTF
ncbi:hypothetical protein [Empedobacter sedimenti]|uniref:hypothetical protein n=1 Tax=Empedobacter sedimenti TaxID=3042610 RepID=UPI0024A70161|nr:hypothetical protein [Empedobacter sedimenti]